MDVSIGPSFEGKTMIFYIDGNVCERYQCWAFLNISRREVGFPQSKVFVDIPGTGLYSLWMALWR